jgi:predicted porin
MPFGRHTFLVSYNSTKLEDDPLLSMQNADSVEASQWALGYRYAITKRTSFYAAYARISQDSELEDGDAATMASYGVTGLAASLGDAGNGGGGYQSGFQFGLKHVF